MIRKANIGDLDKIMLSAQLIIEDMNSMGNFQWDNIYPTKNDFKIDILNESLYIKEFENNVIAFICVDLNEPIEYKSVVWSSTAPSMTIHRLGVIPKMKKKGIATELLLDAEKISFSKNIYFIKADTHSINSNMIALFQKLDYKQTTSIFFEKEKGEFVCFEKNLTSSIS